MEQSNVEIQREYNRIHTDGAPISYEELACDYMADFAKQIKGWEGPDADPSLLDVGCRLGYAFFPYIEQFPAARVVGLDLVKEFVDIAATEAECHEGDICALPFRDEEFDYVFCSQTLEHAIYPELAARELMRVARKAVYVSIPIEPITQFHENASHNKQAEDPLDFVLLFKAPGWRFEWGKFPPKPEGTADFNFVMRRGAKNELPL